MLKIVNEEKQLVGTIDFGSGISKTGKEYHYMDTKLRVGDMDYNVRKFLDSKDFIILSSYIIPENNK